MNLSLLELVVKCKEYLDDHSRFAGVTPHVSSFLSNPCVSSILSQLLFPLPFDTHEYTDGINMHRRCARLVPVVRKQWV